MKFNNRHRDPVYATKEELEKWVFIREWGAIDKINSDREKSLKEWGWVGLGDLAFERVSQIASKEPWQRGFKKEHFE